MRRRSGDCGERPCYTLENGAFEVKPLALLKPEHERGFEMQFYPHRRAADPNKQSTSAQQICRAAGEDPQTRQLR